MVATWWSSDELAKVVSEGAGWRRWGTHLKACGPSVGRVCAVFVAFVLTWGSSASLPRVVGFAFRFRCVRPVLGCRARLRGRLTGWLLTWGALVVVVVVVWSWRGGRRGVAGTSLVGPGGARLGDVAVVLDG